MMRDPEWSHPPQVVVKSSLDRGLGSSLRSRLPPLSLLGTLDTGLAGSATGRGALTGAGADFHPQKLDNPCRDSRDPAVDGVAAVLGVSGEARSLPSLLAPELLAGGGPWESNKLGGLLCFANAFENRSSSKLISALNGVPAR